MTWLLMLSTYLFLLAVLFGAIGQTYGQESDFYSHAVEDFGEGFTLDIVTGLTILPVWLDILLVGIPFAFAIYIVITNSTPTTNAGA